jgi:CRP-like cAMP-binding protein
LQNIEMTLSRSASTEFIERKVRHFERRARIPLRQDYFWQIESGVVRTLTCLENGSYVTLGLWGATDILSPLLSKANPYQIECLTPVEAILLPLDRYEQINTALIRQFQQLQAFIEILHSRPVEFSLLRLLNWLAKKFGREVEKGHLIDLRLTHQEIAEILGITRVTVTRLLRDFEQQGAIARLPHKFIVLRDRDPFWYYEI